MLFDLCLGGGFLLKHPSPHRPTIPSPPPPHRPPFSSPEGSGVMNPKATSTAGLSQHICINVLSPIIVYNCIIYCRKNCNLISYHTEVGDLKIMMKEKEHLKKYFYFAFMMYTYNLTKSRNGFEIISLHLIWVGSRIFLEFWFSSSFAFSYFLSKNSNVLGETLVLCFVYIFRLNLETPQKLNKNWPS